MTLNFIYKQRKIIELGRGVGRGRKGSLGFFANRLQIFLFVGRIYAEESFNFF